MELNKDICEENILIQDYYFFLKKLDLTEYQFKQICLSKNKNFKEFNNSYKFYKFFKKILF